MPTLIDPRKTPKADCMACLQSSLKDPSAVLCVVRAQEGSVLWETVKMLCRSGRGREAILLVDAGFLDPALARSWFPYATSVGCALNSQRQVVATFSKGDDALMIELDLVAAEPRELAELGA